MNAWNDVRSALGLDEPRPTYASDRRGAGGRGGPAGPGPKQGAKPGTTAKARQRPPQRAPRVPFAVLVVTLIAGGLGLLLLLNTASAANEVRRHALSAQDAGVAAQLQQLQNEVAASAAPANLAAAAAELGMVPAGNPAFLVVGSNGTVKVMGHPARVSDTPLDTIPGTKHPKPKPTPKPTPSKSTSASRSASKPTGKATSASTGRATGKPTGRSSSPPPTHRATPTATPTPTLVLPGGDR